jgi:hypothetical protein
MIKPKMIFHAVLLIGLSCLGLAVMLSVLQSFLPVVQVQTLISTLSDGFKLCLGALLALLNERSRRVGR